MVAAHSSNHQQKARKPIPFGKTHQKALFANCRYVFLTTQQAARLFGNRRDFIQTTQKELASQELGYLLRIRALRETDVGSAPFAYTPSQRGWQWAEAEYGLTIPVRYRPSEEMEKPSPHTSAITDVGIALERACRDVAPKLILAQFQHERVIPFLPVSLPGQKTAKFRPDAWIELHLQLRAQDDPEQICYVIEIDKASEYQTKFREKLRKLLHYSQHSYKEHFATESITVLFFVPTIARRKQLLKWIEEELKARQQQARASLFLVSEVDPTKIGTSIFIRECWFRPFAEEPLSLVEATLLDDGYEEDTGTSSLTREERQRMFAALGARLPTTRRKARLEGQDE